MKKYLLFLLSFYCLFANGLVLAQNFFSDDFSTNLDKWTLVNGSMTYWQIDNQALHASIFQSGKLSTIVPKDEFWQGMNEYIVDFVFKTFDASDKNFVIGMRDASNFYDFHFYNNQLIVEDIRMGYSLHSATVPFILQLNKEYSMHLIYSKEKIELFVDGVKFFATDQFWSPPIYGGKFGLKISTGSLTHSQAYFDQVKIRDFNSKDVIFKQNDPLWATKIYDHANLWSQEPSMSRWACALSSAAMLLRAYNYYFLANGTEIDPWSLNQWLLTQSDGYIADGLLNWLALSRLSKILSDLNHNLLPKLEFSYYKDSEKENLTVLKNNLNEDAVQIAATTKHFFLVTDYLTDQNDFIIKDPLYEYNLLSERTDKIDSLRLFKPSFTDLSYLLLVLPKEMIFSLFNEQGKIENLQTLTETIEVESEKIGQNYKLVYYRKPDSAMLNLLLDSSHFNQELIKSVKLYIYDQNARLQLINLADLINADQDLTKIGQLSLDINYHKDADSLVALKVIEKTTEEQEQTVLIDLANQSKQDFAEGKISFYLFYQLNLLIESLHKNLDYFFLLKKFLDFYQL